MKRMAPIAIEIGKTAACVYLTLVAQGSIAQEIAYEDLMCRSVADGYELRVDRRRSEFRLVGHRHLVNDLVAKNADGSINVVVEIPAGCHDKWEVDHGSGQLKWDLEDGQPRIVDYLPYVANYGMVPGTILLSETGGDGDPLDVLVLGPSQPRGAIVRARLLGVLRLTDAGEQDDKLIAIADEASPNTPFAGVTTIDELEKNHVVAIVEDWFLNYKGPGVVVSHGVDGRRSAEHILEVAIESYSTH